MWEYVYLSIFLFCMIFGIYMIVNGMADILRGYDDTFKEKSKSMDDFYRYFEDRDYRTFVSSDSYEGLCAEIKKYKNKEDTKYVDVCWLTCNGERNLFSAFLIVTRDVKKYRELMSKNKKK